MSKTGPQVFATQGPVLIVGTGLLGTSLGLRLRSGHVPVLLSDISPTNQMLARDMGAGVLAEESSLVPTLVVVASPPDVVGQCVVQALVDYPDAIVTDVASVKMEVQRDLFRGLTELGTPGLAARWCSCHPMAGRERSGAGAADSDLFVGRPWVVVPHADTAPQAVLAVRNLGTDMGAVLNQLEGEAHDQAVALVSHVPQLMSSLLAGRLAEAPAEALELAGGGLRDTTRVAASDPRLWNSIIAGNAGPIVRILHAVSEDLDDLITHLDQPGGPYADGLVGTVNRIMHAGNVGVERIPGKHGGAPQHFAEVEVLVPDEPGELGRLFTELGDKGINIEDLTLEHSASQPVGLARIKVQPARARDAEIELTRLGWRIIAHFVDHATLEHIEDANDVSGARVVGDGSETSEVSRTSKTSKEHDGSSDAQ